MQQRNKAITLIFSLLPGAAHMFMGFMKSGLSFMTAFFGIIAISYTFLFEALLWIVPVLWFYAFFDGINKAWSTPEAFAQMEDRYLFALDSFGGLFGGLFARRRLLFGTGVLLCGLYLLYHNVVLSIIASRLSAQAQQIVWSISYHFPQAVAALVVIVLGLRLIIGKRKEVRGDD